MLNASQITASLLSMVRTKLVPAHIPADRFDNIASELLPSLTESWVTRLARVPWGGWLERAELPRYEGQNVTLADGRRGIIERLDKGGFFAHVNIGGRTERVHSSLLRLDPTVLNWATDGDIERAPAGPAGYFLITPEGAKHGLYVADPVGNSFFVMRGTPPQLRQAAAEYLSRGAVPTLTPLAQNPDLLNLFLSRAEVK